MRPIAHSLEAARPRPGWTAAAVLSGALCAFTLPARAQLEEGIEGWARAVTGVTTAKWAGERVPYPTPEARPQSLLALRSWLSPVAVHVPADWPRVRAQHALRALEHAHALLEEVGWQATRFDGQRGGDSALDVYLTYALAAGARAGVDASEPVTYLDAATPFGLADARVPDSHLAACVTSAYVQALRMAEDPAEAESVRRAAGAYVAWLITGTLGCDDSPLAPWNAPWRSVMGHTPDANGAGLWALLGARQDRNRGRYVRDIWSVARQRTWEGDGLRGSPDTWEALNAVLDAHNEEFLEVMDELAVHRYLDGPALIAGASRPPLAGRYAYDALPIHTRPTEPALEPIGSAYYLVDTAQAPDKAALRIWLRGEYGVRWALSAVRLDSEGRDLGRVNAPARDYPRSYLAMDLTADTQQVLIVVTNLSSRLPDADAPDENVRAAHLVIDQGARPTP